MLTTGREGWLYMWNLYYANHTCRAKRAGTSAVMYLRRMWTQLTCNSTAMRQNLKSSTTVPDRIRWKSTFKGEIWLWRGVGCRWKLQTKIWCVAEATPCPTVNLACLQISTGWRHSQRRRCVGNCTSAFIWSWLILLHLWRQCLGSAPDTFSSVSTFTN